MRKNYCHCGPGAWEGYTPEDFAEMSKRQRKELRSKKQKEYWAVFDANGKYIFGTLSFTRRGAFNSQSIHEMDVIEDGGAGGIGNWEFIRSAGFSVRKALVVPKYKKRKKKSFSDYQNDENYARDMKTGKFVNIKTGKRINFSIGAKR